MAIDNDTAILFHSLTTPCPPPSYLTDTLGADRDRTLARLVYDGVLQIQREDGAFVDGLDAHFELFDETVSPTLRFADHPITLLSHAAIQYGAEIRCISEVEMFRRLYRYHATPRTSAWQSRLPDRKTTWKWLGLSSPAGWRRTMRKQYARQRVAKRDPWLRWQRRGREIRRGERHKVYVSPAALELPEVFARVVTICCAMGVPAFKIGSDLAGILRPDKLVLYLPDEEAVTTLGRELSVALEGIAAQSVPFTAPLDESGLLSWAIDPNLLLSSGFPGGSSWRMFIVTRLVTALKRARTAHAERIVSFALQRIRLEGIEPEGWQPVADW